MGRVNLSDGSLVENAEVSAERTERRWSVGLVIDDAELGPLSASEIVQTMYLPGVVHGMVFGWSVIDSEGDKAGLKMVVSATDAAAAAGRAENLLFWARRAAKLPTATVPVAWVMPLREGEESSDRFIDHAKDLLEGETPELASVAAHIHLEVQVRALLEHAQRETEVEVTLQDRGIGNLNSPKCRAVVRDLLGVDVTQSTYWPEFEKSVVRRNAIVHEGEAIDEDQAKATVAMVRGLVTELAEAAGLR